jgi:ribosome maturation factor RimP
MEVASPGLNRRLRGIEDYRRFSGQLAKIKVRGGEKPGYSVTGRIISIDDVELGIKCDGEIVRILLENIKEARLVPEIPGYEEGEKRIKKRRK